MSTFKALMEKFAKGFEVYGQHRVRIELLAMSERQLRDLGYSRYLLEKGTEFWPWRLEEAQIHSEAQKFMAKSETAPTHTNEKAAA